MNPDSLFSICNSVALIGWILLIAGLWWSKSRQLVQWGLVPILLGLVYLFLIVKNFGSSEGGFGSLAQVATLFENPNMLLAGWVHYLAFDLWVGSWELGDSRKHQIHWAFMIPCFFLTFMFGPIGLLVYLLIRALKTKRLTAHENF